MNEVIKSIGQNAGILWDVLNKEGPQVQTKLMKKTRLSENDFYGAVGWLARENKIRKDNRTYKIGETNLTEKIGTDAGKVWNALDGRNELDVSTIARLANIEKRDCYSALGWLAREKKIITKIKVKKK